MAISSAIDSGTVHAYLETHYLVGGDTPMTLRIGEASPLLGQLHKASHAKSSAFITACNPLGRIVDDKTNAERSAMLARELRVRGLKVVEGIGQHPSNAWPGEASLLVLRLSLEAAKALGNRYEQNAIVWCGTDTVPQLVLLR